MHPLVQFHAINRPPVSGLEFAITPPEPGNLPSDLLRVASAILANHTATPDHCWFCLWNGYGWLRNTAASRMEFTPTGASAAPAATLDDATDSMSLSQLLPAAVQNVPCVHLPNRDYHLLEGPLEAATELGWNLTSDCFFPQSPNLFWPDDHAWCVATEIDLFCTLVAGSNALAESLLADPRLEVWRVLPDDPVTWGSDDINT